MSKAIHKFRLNQSDAHYGGNLVDGARLLQCFGDVATELCIQESGDEGLFRAYENAEFLAPVYAGDFLEVHGEIISKGNTSRKMSFEVYKIIEAIPNTSKAKILDQPILICKAVGTCVLK